MKFFYLLIIVLFISSCASPEKMLSRTWKITEVVFNDSLNTLSKQQHEVLERNLKHDLTFSFMKDSIYQVKSSGAITNSKWWLSKDKKKLFTITPEGVVVESTIIELKKTELKFESKGEYNQTFDFTCSPVTGTK